MTEEYPELDFLVPHPVAKLASLLGDHLGIGADCISLAMFLSRAAGRLGVPFNLAIFSEDAGTERLISDRLINIVPETVRRAETIKQLGTLSDQRFDGTELVLVRSRHESLFRFACETACRDISTISTPSVWLITDDRSTVAIIGPTLSLMANQTDRQLTGFGHEFSKTTNGQDQCSAGRLRQLLLQLGNRIPHACPFESCVRADLNPNEMLIVNRLLTTIASVRVEMLHSEGKYLSAEETEVSLDDYRVTRELLLNLPVPGAHSNLSPHAAETGEILYDEIVCDSEYQLSIPDNSDFGVKGFTRKTATKATGFSYNTVKNHLEQLEDEGVLESLVVRSIQKGSLVRKQGRQIYFKFANARSPPFGTNSPFTRLPTVKKIAEDCTGSLQSQTGGLTGDAAAYSEATKEIYL
jgi:hypothetical protein